MRRMQFCLSLILFLFVIEARSQQLVIKPTTTLSAETSNNTSASSLFNDTYNTQYGANTTNGDAVPGNISKVNIRSLLYPNSATRVFAHTQSWFCHDTGNVVNGTLSPNAFCGGHIDIGYTSGATSGTTQEHLQVQEMLTRGIQGAVVNWYGLGRDPSDSAAKNFKAEAENSGGQFSFGVNIDKGAFGTACQSTCCPTTPVPACTSEAINLVNDVMNTYAGSTAYIKTPDGRPILFFFVDDGTNPRSSMIDWNQVHANVTGNPEFIFDNKQGFTVTGSNGAYGWENTGDGDPGLSSLNDFYNSAAAHGSMTYAGAVFKGFNDRLASWSPPPGRINDQQCGKTWLQTFATTNSHFSASAPLDLLGVVTWDDYEEGTEIETGIDNCVQSVAGSITGSASSTAVSWTVNFGTDPLNSAISGDESTIDHYTVFISTDGQNLMALQDVAAGTHTLNLCQFNIPQGDYTLYVKAVGKPSITNHMSGAIPYTQGSPCSSSDFVTVSVTSPTNGATVSSPVSVQASATSSQSTISSWRVFVDGVDTFDAGAVNSISTSIGVGGGQHTLIVRAFDAAGNFGDQTLTVTVPSTVTVTVSSPANNSNVSSPVSIAASASSANTITGWHIYVDGVDSFSAGQVNSINASITIAAGTHTVIVRAWNSTGAFGDQTLTLNVVSGVAVNVTTPANNATVNSPVAIAANANSSHTITGWHIYVDSVDSFSAGQVNSINANVTMSVGAHTVIVRAWDSTGAFGDQTLTLNVVSGVTVTVSTPTNNATVHSPTTIAASATSSQPIAGWHIYVDSTDVYHATGVSSISPAISMNPGTHTVVVRAWDNTGAFGDQTLTLNVVSGVAVTVSSPANNANVTSPVAIDATATSGNAITGWHIYVDSNSVYTGAPVTSINPGIDMSAGLHTVVVRAWDSTGAFGDQTLTLNVTASSGVVVSVTDPPDQGTLSSPVTFNASASSSNTITGWHIYIDSVDSFSAGQVNSISPSLSMGAGQHTVVIRAWDSTGAFGDRTLNVTIQ